LWDSHYRFGKVGIYLQDNTLEFGGGIDVAIGSHKAFRNLKNLLLSKIWTGLIHRAASKDLFYKKISVSIKAGSAVYFDSRLLHRSTPPASVELSECEKNVERVSLLEKQCKYTIYWECCTRNYSEAFLTNSQLRALLEEE